MSLCPLEDSFRLLWRSLSSTFSRSLERTRIFDDTRGRNKSAVGSESEGRIGDGVRRGGGGGIEGRDPGGSKATQGSRLSCVCMCAVFVRG